MGTGTSAPDTCRLTVTIRGTDYRAVFHDDADPEYSVNLAPDRGGAPPWETLDQALTTRLALDALDFLDAREDVVIRLRFGIGYDPMSLRQIGPELGMSYETVRQNESFGLAKLAARLQAE